MGVVVSRLPCPLLSFAFPLPVFAFARLLFLGRCVLSVVVVTTDAMRVVLEILASVVGTGAFLTDQ